jgi:hypothetical protein
MKVEGCRPLPSIITSFNVFISHYLSLIYGILTEISFFEKIINTNNRASLFSIKL